MNTLQFTLALVLAALMGFAIQRGATCTVAAVDEILTHKRAHRLLAMAEASIWVLGFILLIQAFGGHPNLMPKGYEISTQLVLGAVLLGLGAVINKACVFGAVAKFGSGEWSYCLTPVGFYLGCLMLKWPAIGYVAAQTIGQSPVLNAPPSVLILIAVWLCWRLLRLGIFIDKTHSNETTRGSLWTPHAATLVIGVSFASLLYLVGPWTYTEALADWASHSVMMDTSRVLLFIMLFTGAVCGGWTAGRFKSVPMTMMASMRTLGGGALMGLGSVLIPGGNDGLILTGMPLLWPYAWLAFATMIFTIGLFLWMSSIRDRRIKMGE